MKVGPDTRNYLATPKKGTIAGIPLVVPHHRLEMLQKDERH